MSSHEMISEKNKERALSGTVNSPHLSPYLEMFLWNLGECQKHFLSVSAAEDRYVTFFCSFLAGNTVFTSILASKAFLSVQFLYEQINILSDILEDPSQICKYKDTFNT